MSPITTVVDAEDRYPDSVPNGEHIFCQREAVRFIKIWSENFEIIESRKTLYSIVLRMIVNVITSTGKILIMNIRNIRI